MLIGTAKLDGVKVLGGKDGRTRLGRVRSFVFHPTKKYCLGFTIKRPDALLMFHRKDFFVPINAFTLNESGDIQIEEGAELNPKAACKAAGVSWESCVLWVGMPLISTSEEKLGYVGNINIDTETGEIKTVEADTGLASNALLGTRKLPANLILGFRQGVGEALAINGNAATAESEEDLLTGAIVVANEALSLKTEGGVAEAAGAAYAQAQDKVKRGAEELKPKVEQAKKKTGRLINKGAYATGKQISRSKNMFADFKKEYDKARKGK